MRLAEVDFSTPLNGVEVIRKVQAHYAPAHKSDRSYPFETKIWTYGGNTRAKLKIWKKYPFPKHLPVPGEKKVEVAIGFSESLLYCCRISLEGMRFRLVSQKTWRKYPNPVGALIVEVDAAFKVWEERQEREDRVHQGILKDIEGLKRRGITAYPCPDNVYWMRIPLGDAKVDFIVDWNTMQMGIKKIETPSLMGVETFQDIIRGLALAFGHTLPSITGVKAARRIMVDKSHTIPEIKRRAKCVRKAKCEARYL